MIKTAFFAIFVLAGGLAAAQDDSRDVASDLRQHWVEIEEIAGERDQTPAGEERDVLSARIARRARSVRSDLRALMKRIEEAAENGSDASADRAVVEEILVVASPLIQREIEHRRDVVEARQRDREERPPGEDLELERQLTRDNQELDAVMSTLLEIVTWKEALSLDATDDEAYFDPILEERSDDLMARTELALRRRDEGENSHVEDVGRDVAGSFDQELFMLGGIEAALVHHRDHRLEAGDVAVKRFSRTSNLGSIEAFSSSVASARRSPNNKIWGDVIRNKTAVRTRRVDLSFGIGYDDDIAHAERVLHGIVDSHELVLEEPPPTVKLHELGDSSVIFVVRPWVKTQDYWDVHWDITRAVKERFDAEGISIPYPQRDVHVHRESTPTEPLEPNLRAVEHTEPREAVPASGISAEDD